MNWTKERPTAAGWYWLRDSLGAAVVRVGAPYDEHLRIYAVGDELSDPIEEVDGEWYGPLEPPVDGTPLVVSEAERIIAATDLSLKLLRELIAIMERVGVKL